MGLFAMTLCPGVVVTFRWNSGPRACRNDPPFRFGGVSAFIGKNGGQSAIENRRLIRHPLGGCQTAPTMAALLFSRLEPK